MEAGGITIPSLGFGLYKVDGDSARDAVVDALAIGYRLLDTAQRYGNEADIGRGIAATSVPRDEYLLSTKLALELNGAATIEATKQSLRKLKTDYLDLLLMHWPNVEVPMEESLAAMVELRESGLVRAIGVSNFTAEQVREALTYTRIVTNQVEYHPFLAQPTVLATAREEDLVLMAYSPLARGAVSTDPVLLDIASAHGKNPAQIALRWLIEQDHVATIPKSASPEMRRSNFDIFDFELSSEDTERINALARGLRLVNPDIAPKWDDQDAPHAVKGNQAP
jgi:diketogulonate reductase-like aldo/keto reductase